MFAAMISFVVINAAFSAATRAKRLKYNEQAFLLAQSMSGIITEALSGDEHNVMLPDNTTVVKSPSGDLKYNSPTVGYLYIDSPVDGDVLKLYNSLDHNTAFTTGTGIKPYFVLKGNQYDSGKEISTAATEVQNLIFEMAKKVDPSTEEPVEEVISTQKNDLPTGETLKVETTLRMSNSYLLQAFTEATVTTASGEFTYNVRMDANPVIRTDNLVCSGLRSTDGKTIEVNFSEKDVDPDTDAELVKVSCYSITWPAEQMNCVYDTSTPEG